jgi:hypothetical protein
LWAADLREIKASTNSHGNARVKPSGLTGLAIERFRQENMEFAMAHTLVSSDRVETAVIYGRDGQKIGTIERLMLEKASGTVAYAVVKCGGFLGSERHHYPVSWTSLKYDPVRKAFEANITLAELRDGPCELDGETFDWGDRSPAYRHPQYWTV